jgi:hypothetical protein
MSTIIEGSWDDFGEQAKTYQKMISFRVSTVAGVTAVDPDKIVKLPRHPDRTLAEIKADLMKEFGLDSSLEGIVIFGEASMSSSADISEISTIEL